VLVKVKRFFNFCSGLPLLPLTFCIGPFNETKSALKVPLVHLLLKETFSEVFIPEEVYKDVVEEA
jgi:hypothetical protein